jgi:hypothetical protein
MRDESTADRLLFKVTFLNCDKETLVDKHYHASEVDYNKAFLDVLSQALRETEDAENDDLLVRSIEYVSYVYAV